MRVSGKLNASLGYGQIGEFSPRTLRSISEAFSSSAARFMT